MARDAKTATREVAGLRSEIENWRRSRYARAPLPDELWVRALSVARRLGAYGGARALGVSYESLRTRLDGRKPCDEQAATPSEFLELSGAQLLTTAPCPAGTVLELVSPDGVRVTLRMGAGENLDVGSLVEALRRRPG